MIGPPLFPLLQPYLRITYDSLLTKRIEVFVRIEIRTQSMHILFGWTERRFLMSNRRFSTAIGELKEPRRRRQQERHKFAYLTIQNNNFARFARAFFTFSHFTEVLALSTA